MYELKTESSFDAAHFLTCYQGKCENLHGHRWRVVAYLRAFELQGTGTQRDMVVDFADLKRVLRELTGKLDHTFLVEDGSLAIDTLKCLEREGFKLSIVQFRTTAENLAKYFADGLAWAGLPVSQVDVYETPNNCASYFLDGRYAPNAPDAVDNQLASSVDASSALDASMSADVLTGKSADKSAYDNPEH